MPSPLMQHSLVVLLALALDALCGDPPNRLHPVAWMGTGIAAAKRHAPKQGDLARLGYGAGLALAGGAATATCGWLAARALRALPRPLRWGGEALALKMMLSLRGLGQAGLEVCRALEGDDLPEARRLLSWHLVSRDTTALTAAQVAAAAVESVAENTSDGVVAPLFYYALAGLPGALAYRFGNTADAMLGYHDPEHEWLGKAPARLDDLLNLIPARLTAGLLTAAAWLRGADARQAIRIRRRDAHKTASPNAGHPMSAMAGALGVELEKTGHYRLGAGLRPARADDIRRAVQLLRTSAILGAGLLLFVGLLTRPRQRKSA